MRTTLDLPDALLHRAKLRALHRRVSLKQVVVDALEMALEDRPHPRQAQRNPPPVVRSRRPGALTLSPAEISAILLREEAATYEVSVRH